MKENIMNYKGYYTKIKVDTTSHKLRGKIEGINDFVDFEGDDVRSAERGFHEAVDDYLTFCAEIGKEPDKVKNNTSGA
jgi:predicted HicB family RNase H-like nuclease